MSEQYKRLCAECLNHTNEEYCCGSKTIVINENIENADPFITDSETPNLISPAKHEEVESSLEDELGELIETASDSSGMNVQKTNEPQIVKQHTSAEDLSKLKSELDNDIAFTIDTYKRKVDQNLTDFQDNINKKISALDAKVEELSIGTTDEIHSEILEGYRNDINALQNEITELKEEYIPKSKKGTVKKSESAEESIPLNLDEVLDFIGELEKKLTTFEKDYAYTKDKVSALQDVADAIGEDYRDLILKRPDPVPNAGTQTSQSQPASTRPPISELTSCIEGGLYQNNQKVIQFKQGTYEPCVKTSESLTRGPAEIYLKIENVISGVERELHIPAVVVPKPENGYTEIMGSQIELNKDEKPTLLKVLVSS